MSDNWKNKLQEYCQKNYIDFPEYIFTETPNLGVGARWNCNVSVYINGKHIDFTSPSYPTKTEAQQVAAHEVLKKINNKPAFVPPVKKSTIQRKKEGEHIIDILTPAKELLNKFKVTPKLEYSVKIKLSDGTKVESKYYESLDVALVDILNKGLKLES